MNIILNVCRQFIFTRARNRSKDVFQLFYRMKSKSAIPDRWIDYKAIGSVVSSTNLVPFKVPLHESICNGLPELERHTTHDIVKTLPNVGLVINLTNTQTYAKYYQPDDWRSNGIDYKWIKVQGHITPPEQLLVQFCRTVKKFTAENPTKLIGIHCTHGLNRTGYFVCSYMVLVLNIDPHDAIQRFNEARGYDIERENYLASIKSHGSNIRLKKFINHEYDETERIRYKLKHTSVDDTDGKRFRRNDHGPPRRIAHGPSWRSGSRERVDGSSRNSHYHHHHPPPSRPSIRNAPYRQQQLYDRSNGRRVDTHGSNPYSWRRPHHNDNNHIDSRNNLRRDRDNRRSTSASKHHDPSHRSSGRRVPLPPNRSDEF